MEKMTFRAMGILLVLGFLVYAPQIAYAQNPLEPTQIVIGAPAQSNLGEALTVQAVLADSQGHPVSGVMINFTTPVTFLGKKGDVILAQATTNANGQAVAQFVNRSSGEITLNAEFQGNDQYAPSSASTQITVVGDGQLYVEHTGVDIPGLNVPPTGSLTPSGTSPWSGMVKFVQNLWPAMSGWPIAVVLILVWSLYLLAVRFILRVAALGKNSGESTELPANSDLRRSS